MCGIAGILSDKPDPAAVEGMVAAMRHRGPDDSGVQMITFDGRLCTLGSSRLAIIDLSPAGHMPMTDPATGNWIVYNGEIYNFRQLRRELEILGATFRSATDTEVVLQAYAAWGTDCVRRLRGMFAFAVWDSRRGELFLARDRIGEKPLYYREDCSNGCFLFASEVRALLASGLVDRRLDRTTLQVYLYNGFTVAPRTMIQSIGSLLPGCWMRVGGDGRIRETRRYWRIPIFTGREQPIEKEDIRTTLAQSVDMRLLSDVPLGVFLSGGLDSSTITALMSRASPSVHSFSIGFHERAYDESRYARWVADKFHTHHSSIVLGPQEFYAWLDDGLAGMDQPTYDGLNTYFISRAAKESGLTVALSGLGGDEVFGGYPFFRSAPLIGTLGWASRWLPQTLRSWIAGRLGGRHGLRKAFHILDEPIPDGMHLLAGYQSSVAMYPIGDQKKLLADPDPQGDNWFGIPREFVDYLSAEGCDSDTASLLSRYILRLFEGERILRDTDSMSMAVSLEVRSVFTDHDLIEKLWSIPGRTRCAGAPDKPFEEGLVKGIVGEGYPARKKQGFIFPFQEWLQVGETGERIRGTLQDSRQAVSSGLNPSGTADIMRLGATLPWSRVWTVFVLMDWARRNRVGV